MATKVYLEDLLAALDREINSLTTNQGAIVGDQPSKGQSELERTPLPSARAVALDLDDTVVRLQLIRQLLTTYPDMVGLIDTVIGHEVAKSAYRERLVAVILALVSALLGWLLSLLATPATVEHLLHW